MSRLRREALVPQLPIFGERHHHQQVSKDGHDYDGRQKEGQDDPLQRVEDVLAHHFIHQTGKETIQDISEVRLKIRFKSKGTLIP